MKSAATEMSDKIVASEKNKVAVLNFKNSDGHTSELGSWLTSVFTTYLENSDNNILVTNSADVEKVLSEISGNGGKEGFDTKTLNRVSELTKSDVILYGEINLMDNEVVVSIRSKVISTNKTIGGVVVSFSATEGMLTKYDKHLDTKPLEDKSTEIAKPIALEERGPKPSKNPDCKLWKTGDYCFENKTNYNLKIYFWRTGAYVNGAKATIQPGQKQCFYDTSSGSTKYAIFHDQSMNRQNYASGNVFVEECQENLYVIE